MKTLLKQAKIIDSTSEFHKKKKDILIIDGVIKEIASNIENNAILSSKIINGAISSFKVLDGTINYIDLFIYTPGDLNQDNIIDILDIVLIINFILGQENFSIAEETVTVLNARSGKVLSTHKMSEKASPSGSAPVEAVFLPKAHPARVYINTMFGNTLWTGVWNSMSQNFSFSQVFDFNPLKQGVPLEIYFNHDLDKMYITSASPGYFNIFDIKNPAKPRLETSIPTAEGSHHVVFSPDERYAFVQNNLLNLAGMSDGSITVIDLKNNSVKMSIDTFKDQGLNPNSIVMMPKWYHDNAH